MNALCGEVSNGGISQFFFNSTLFLRDAVATALERIGAAEAAGRYANVSSRSKSNGRLGWIRRLATGWRDYLSYKEELGGEQAIDAEFDDWFFADGQDGLEALTRTYLSGREHDLIRFCDGDPGLEARWTSRRLARLVYDFDQYQDAFERGTRYGFFDLLFTPECRLGLGDSPEERLERGRLIAIELMPLIRSAVEQPKTAHYSELPSPRILVENLSAAGGNCAVTVAYHENELDLMWSIAEWR